MLTLLAFVAILSAALVFVVRLALAGRPTPDENDPRRQHVATDPSHPHPEPGGSASTDQPTGMERDEG